MRRSEIIEEAMDDMRESGMSEWEIRSHVDFFEE